MKTLRLALVAVALATTVAPGVASAGIGCTVYWTEEQVGPVTFREPRCAW